MGLDASVMCNCYARGLITPPPHRERVRVDEDGYLDLDLPWESHQAEHRAFDEWLACACPHGDMKAASTHISNWAGYRLFQEALGLVGWDQFPTLAAMLPDANGGQAPAAQSALCLKELRIFEQRYRTSVPALFDTDTGAMLHLYVRSYHGIFIHGGSSGVDVGIDAHGLFVRDRQDTAHRELFRALRIEQRPFVRNGREGADLIDLDSGACLTVALRIHGDSIPWPDGRMQDDQGRFHFAEPARMHVAPHEQTSASFDFILENLRTVFTASVETGNPVRWC